MTATDTHFATPYGLFALRRFPARKKDTLRAWDAADEYLLNTIEQEKLLDEASSVLVVNDSHGALTIPLAPFHPIVLGDSYTSHRSILENLRNNDLAIDSVTLLDPTATETINDIKALDLVIIKIPKTLSLLEQQLRTIRPLINTQTKIIGAAMVKHIHNSTLALFEGIIGPTRTSLAKKKARLIFPTLDANIDAATEAAPIQYTLEHTPFRVTNHANVFSQETLDIGTRLFLQHIPQANAAKVIVDLGCGNGVVGLIAAQRNPQAAIVFTDESFFAVASAKATFSESGLNNPARFTVDDCLSAVEEAVDIILCNPPFHQDHAVGDQVALRMFRSAAKKLQPGGELWVIGNRHLGYHTKLAALFSQVTSIASNKKFVVFKAIL